MILSVRSAQAADIDAVSRLQEEVWHTSFPGIDLAVDPPSAASIEKRRRTGADFQARHPDYLLLLEDENGSLAGFSHFEPRVPDVYPYGSEIQTLHVHPARQGRGAGTLLLRAMLDHIASLGFQNTMLWTLESNQRARSLYQKLGGRPSVREEHDFGEFAAWEVAYVWDALRNRTGAR